MRERTILVLAAAALIMGAGAHAAQETGDLLRLQDTLGAEYGLARSPNFYFVLDVGGKTLELRVRGEALKSWPLKAMRFWGRPSFQGHVELKSKSALKAPRRIVIRPRGPEEKGDVGTEDQAAGFEPEALELKDMPESFRLEFDNGFHVSVRSARAVSGNAFKRLWSFWRWHVGLPLLSLFDRRKTGADAWLELIFEDKEDAQAIYWHFYEGINGIIL